jgi:hypothetical protein
MGGIRFRRHLVTIMMLLMLCLIVLNADRAFPLSLPPSPVLTRLLSTPLPVIMNKRSFFIVSVFGFGLLVV